MENTKLNILFTLFIMANCVLALAQENLSPRPLQVSGSMTTNIIFSQPILSVDLGSGDLLAQRAQGVQNILQLKAGRVDFEQTNLTVITQDGSLHSFMVSYSEQPQQINISVQQDQDNQSSSRSIPNNTQFPPKEIREGLEWVRRTDLVPVRLSDEAEGIQFSLDGIFIQRDRMFFRFRFYNSSHIPFSLNHIRLFLKDAKSARRSAVQELELIPEFTDSAQTPLLEHIQHTIILVLPKFTIPKGKYLSIELMESDASRNLGLRVKNKHILRTLPIPFIH